MHDGGAIRTAGIDQRGRLQLDEKPEEQCGEQPEEGEQYEPQRGLDSRERQRDRCRRRNDAHPRVHALYANKRNLAVLSDAERLRALGVTEDIACTRLSGIPRTEIVDAADAARLWSQRRKLFFKPAAGFGSKAAYQGDKLTKRVWEQILAGDYVAQALVPPGERLIADHQAPLALKFDVRNYVYDGAVQFITARPYQGQTTNFRTPGGSFAPVFTEATPESGPVPACTAAPAVMRRQNSESG